MAKGRPKGSKANLFLNFCDVCNSDTPHFKAPLRCKTCSLMKSHGGRAKLASFNIDGTRKTVSCQFRQCTNAIPATLTQKQKFCAKTHLVTCAICDNSFEASSKNPKSTCSKGCQQKLFEATMQEKYGVNNPSQVPQVQQKISSSLKNLPKETWYSHARQEKNLKELGVRFHTQDEGFKERIKAIFEEKYGGVLFGSSQLTTKIENTLRARYGVSNFAKSELFVPRMRATFLEKYGTEYPIFKKSNQSRGECEVREFVNSIYDGVVTKDRTVLRGKELDIYLPLLKLAIEYNGEYWHHDLRRDLKGWLPSDWLRWKQQQCQKEAVQLIFIWEKDWQNNRELTELRLRNVLKSRKADFKSLPAEYDPRTITLDEAKKVWAES